MSLAPRRTNLFTKEKEDELIPILKALDEGKEVRNKSAYRHYISTCYLVRVNGTYRVCRKQDGREMVPVERMMETIQSVHDSIHHRGLKETLDRVHQIYANIPKYMVEEAIDKCYQCRRREAKVKYEFSIGRLPYP